MRKFTIPVLLLLTLSSLYGQQRDTVYITLTTDYVGDSSDDFDLPASASIGQLHHEFTIVFKDRTGQTCSAPHDAEFGARVYGSYDNSVFNLIPTKLARRAGPSESPYPAPTATNRYRQRIIASGAQPYIRLGLTGWNITECVLDVHYSGTINPPVDIDLGLQAYNAGASVYTPELIYHAFALVAVAAAEEIEIEDGTDDFDRIAVYGIVFFVSDAEADVSLFAEDPDDPGEFPILRFDNLPADTGFMAPITGHSWGATTGFTQNLYFRATCTGCTVTGTLYYRRGQ